MASSGSGSSSTPKVWNPDNLPVVKDKSLGIIPCRYKAGSWEVFIIQQRAGYWCFCKGHPKATDKSEYETACRELKEETNMEVKKLLFEDKVQEQYGFNYKKHAWKDKTVEYWLAEVIDDSVIKLQVEEVQAFKWIPAGEVHKQMTYFQAKELSKSVAEKLANYKLE
ncbi:hypothetical protein LOD99_16125 [Oopsacas minuta]|uniref:Nudix hydrolase domain-containing protein n=1 Tax=Oopsacas minuta TaxID=111878 RepID=A0AAV7K6A4_9METZ|nr:hypothetical protein LOD99_16125 [Oopsacas minuta]